MAEEKLNYHLGEKILFSNVEDIYKQLKEIDLTSAKSIDLDAEDLEELDLIGLQLLTAFVKKAKNLLRINRLKPKPF